MFCVSVGIFLILLSEETLLLGRCYITWCYPGKLSKSFMYVLLRIQAMPAGFSLKSERIAK